jgi:hypothetical protein
MMMAHNSSKRKVKASKLTQDAMNRKHYGDEPSFGSHEISDNEYMHAVHWYNCVCSKEDAREFLEQYLKSVGREETAKILSRVPDCWFPDHSAWIARMHMRGVVLKQRSLDAMEAKIESALLHSEKPKQVVSNAPKPSIQERIEDKVSNVIGLFEQSIDSNGFTVSMYDMLNQHQIPPMLAQKIKEYYQPICDEAVELLKRSCDPQLKEGFENWTAAQLKERAKFYWQIIEDCNRYGAVNKTVRKPRKKKQQSPDKKLKLFKHQQSSTEFELRSINPTKILGAEELWCFNTKYKTITQFVAISREGLDVKRSSVAKYDPNLSNTYRTGRKTKEIVGAIQKGGKRAVAKVIEQLTKAAFSDRISENTILVKVN